MYTGKIIFSQLLEHLPLHVFHKCVDRYQGDFKIKNFTCLDQYLCMAFAQLTYRESLRDIEACLQAQKNKLYHMGIRSAVSRNNLANANKVRNWRIYADLAHALIQTARKMYAGDSFALELENTVYALDATTIDLCLSMFPWAKFRTSKGAIKLHTLLDLRGNIPTFIHISDGKLHEVNTLDILPLEAGAFYVMDRGYLDFARLHTISRHNAFFVIRAKSNLKYRRIYSHEIDRTTGLICDQSIMLTGFYQGKDYPDKMRRIKYYDAKTEKTLVFLTNNFSLPAMTIAELYRNRWQVGVSRKGHITQSVEVRPRERDSTLVAWEVPWRETKTVKPSDNIFFKGNMQHTRPQRTVNVDVASLHEIPVAETVDNARRQQGLTEMNPMRPVLTGGVSAVAWSEGLCGNWRSPRCPAKKSRRGGKSYNLEWEKDEQVSGWRIGL